MKHKKKVLLATALSLSLVLSGCGSLKEKADEVFNKNSEEMANPNNGVPSQPADIGMSTDGTETSGSMPPNDGTGEVTANPDGSNASTNPDGSVTTTNPDGSVTTSTDGTTTTEVATGSEDPNTTTDGTVAIDTASGEVETTTTDEDMYASDEELFAHFYKEEVVQIHPHLGKKQVVHYEEAQDWREQINTMKSPEPETFWGGIKMTNVEYKEFRNSFYDDFDNISEKLLMRHFLYEYFAVKYHHGIPTEDEIIRRLESIMMERRMIEQTKVPDEYMDEFKETYSAMYAVEKVSLKISGVLTNIDSKHETNLENYTLKRWKDQCEYLEKEQVLLYGNKLEELYFGDKDVKKEIELGDYVDSLVEILPQEYKVFENPCE